VDLYRYSDGAVLGLLVATDIPWGYYEDVETNDPDTKYTIIYLGANNEHIAVLNDSDISRYNRPDGMCRVTFSFSRPDGSPDKCRMIEVSDEVTGTGTFVRKLCTNNRGKAVFFAQSHSRLLFRLDGDSMALDVAIPDVRDITYEELVPLGSVVDVDPRRSIGLN
jgi:hypothetical protein